VQNFTPVGAVGPCVRSKFPMIDGRQPQQHGHGHGIGIGMAPPKPLRLGVAYGMAPWRANCINQEPTFEFLWDPRPGGIFDLLPGLD
jgi:hypothetical protein